MAQHHHGSTPAAWTLVGLVLLGFLVGAAGMVIDNWTVFWVGVAIAVFGLVVGKVMQNMGMGTR